MSGIQNFVYALEVGNLRAWIVRIALASLVVGTGIYYAVTQFNGFNAAESMDMAQIGRNVVEGQGFSTKFVRPIILKDHPEFLSNINASNTSIPELVQPPAYPTLLATLFMATSSNFDVPMNAAKDFRLYRPEISVLVMNILLLLLSSVIFYLWMVRTFNKRIASFATVLFLGSDLMWSMTISGLPMQFIIFLVCIAGFCLNEALIADETVEGEGMSVLWLSIAAIMVGVLVLTRYSMLAIYIPFAALGFMVFGRKITCGLVASLIPLALFLPWLIRNTVISGNPFGYAWVHIFAYDSTLWRVFSDETGNYIGFNPLVRGFLNGFGNCFSNLSSFFGSIIIPAIFILGFFHVFKRERIKIAHWFWATAFVLLLVFNSMVIKSLNVLESPELNSLFALFPILAGFGAAFAFVLVDRIQLSTRVLRAPIFVLICLLQLYPLGLRLIQHRPPPIAYPPYIPQWQLTYYKYFLNPTEMQACDMPWAGAWYSNRLTLWLPRDRDDFNKIDGNVFSISSLWLTPVSMNVELQSKLRNGEFAGWGPLIEQMDTVMYLAGKDRNTAGIIMQNITQEQPLPYFAPFPITKTDFYYYFTKKQELNSFLQKMREGN